MKNMKMLNYVQILNITVRICELRFGVIGAEKFRIRNMGTSKVSKVSFVCVFFVFVVILLY